MFPTRSPTGNTKLVELKRSTATSAVKRLTTPKRSAWDALPSGIHAETLKLLPFHSKLSEVVCIPWKAGVPRAERALSCIQINDATRPNQGSILVDSKVNSKHVVQAFHPARETVIQWLSRRLQSISPLEFPSANSQPTRPALLRS